MLRTEYGGKDSQENNESIPVHQEDSLDDEVSIVGETAGDAVQHAIYEQSFGCKKPKRDAELI
jgi:hypothetical protein